MPVPPAVPQRTVRPGRPRRAPPSRSAPPEPERPVPFFDPHEVELGEGTHTLNHDPLDAGRRHLVDQAFGINGLPLDWALLADPLLDDTLIAVRARPDGIGTPAWFSADRRLREETFSSPLAGRTWNPDTTLVRRLLTLTPYVVARHNGDRVQYALDVRSVDDLHALSRVVASVPEETVLPASGAYATQGTELAALAVRVPFAGDRFARSTRKRFRLASPGGAGDATVEGAAARILNAQGWRVESPRVLVALYRLLIGEVVAHWWRDPVRIEAHGARTHHPPGANPLEATLCGLEGVHRVQCGEARAVLEQVGDALVASGRRPPEYRRYLERLAVWTDEMGPQALAGCLEGVLRGHGAIHADLVAAHRGRGHAFLVEVKSTGDRIRPTQVESALWHARDGRCGYRLMKVIHTPVPSV